MFILKPHRRSAGAQSGQSMVEFALSLTILLTLLSGTIDFGRIFFALTQLTDAAGEGALYLSFNPRCRTPVAGQECHDPNNGMYRVQHAGGGLVDWAACPSMTGCSITFTYLDTTNPPPGYAGADIYDLYGTQYQLGDTVVVQIKYPFRLLTPLIPHNVCDQTAGSSVDTTTCFIVLTGRASQPIIDK